MTNIFRKTLLILLAVVMLTSSAYAAPSSSSLMRGGRNSAETSLERSLESGITITCDGLTLKDNYIYIGYTVLSEEDAVVKVEELTDLFDDRGDRLKAPAANMGVYIGGEQVTEREVIGSVPTSVIVRYPAETGYTLAETYTRVSLSVNGEKLTFRGIPINHGIADELSVSFSPSNNTGSAPSTNAAPSNKTPSRTPSLKRSELGVSLQNLSKEFAEAYGVKHDFGAIVGDVFPGLAAARAGIQRGDVIVEINGEKVKDMQWLIDKINFSMPGTSVSLKVVRNRSEQSLTATLTGREKAFEEIGLYVAQLDWQLARKYGIANENRKDVVVTRLGSKARSAGVREGDLLLEANGKKLTSLFVLSQAIVSAPSSIALLIERAGKTSFITMDVE
ncbi:hypothetical protein FACS1894204_11240 [Synergistales bacterium]|nr:hypothetical protein FACS1894204_11240 [Synergistales bacterium]